MGERKTEAWANVNRIKGERWAKKERSEVQEAIN